ncbi:MAG: NADH-quinone oxidoreductase subunit NuoG [Kangiellaceae bacterium]|jgi:NADH-quinone oxidoreductase subunit G|nr:NADH-quinone oxidoreductase subunit NuoG [Kangiellaceae bacterium]
MGIVHVEIDGVALEAETGSMIIEVADAAGISVPRFCYHKKLSVAANCRMCLVDVTNLPKAVPACATPVAEGMKILTDSSKARNAQKSVMEFLLINHPLDCPICDQGGECELQDVAMGYGGDVSRFTEGKRVVKDKDIGPLVETDMTRCIHCTRCVRFGTEIAGMRELGATGRGEHMEIGTFVEKSMASEVSGNIIDLCPVGALTAKPSRFKARAWEMQTTASIAPHDCVGTNIEVHHRRGEVIRVVPRENEAINEVWITDRDRFSYQALNQAARLTQPKIKRDGKWHTVDWETALNEVVSRLEKIKQHEGAEQIGMLLSPSSTTEEMFLAQQLMRGIGSNNIDHRLRRIDFSDQHDEPMKPSFDISIEQLDDMDATLLIGADLRFEQPLLSLRLRKSTRFGRVMSIHSHPLEENYVVSPSFSIAPEQYADELQGIVVALIEQYSDPLPAELTDLFKDAKATAQQATIASELRINENACVLLGQSVLEHSQSSTIKWLARTIAELSGCGYGELTHGANTHGGHIAGALPHREAVAVESDVCGWNTQQMLQKGLSAYLLLNTEPEFDSAFTEAANTSLRNAECVVVMSAFSDGPFKEYADIMLPVAGFTETSGTFVNCEGKWQSFTAAVAAKGEARPAWKVLRVLGNLFDLENFHFTSSSEVIEYLYDLYENVSDKAVGHNTIPESICSAGDTPPLLAIYDIDPLTRRALALQQSILGQKNWRLTAIENLSRPNTGQPIPVKEIEHA